MLLRLLRLVVATLALVLAVMVPDAGHAQSGATSEKPPVAPGLEALLRKAGWIQIGLAKSVSAASANVSGTARCSGPSGQVYDGQGGAFRATAGPSGVTLSLPDGRRVSAEWFVIEQSGATETQVFEYSGNPYRGRLQLVRGGGGMRVINQVRIDDYLKGVLPAEIGPSPMEALKAQAVAARSETIFKLATNRHTADGFDLCTQVHCQAYKGMRLETADSNRAVDETVGYVLMNGEGRILDAVYSNVCGGVSAGAEDVWDSRPIPGLSPVFDSARRTGTPRLGSEDAFRRFMDETGADHFCDSSNAGYPKYALKYYRWRKSLSADELRKAAGVGRVRDIQVTERRESGRVRKLRISGDSGEKVIEKELPIRNALGLWSGLFYLDVRKAGGYVENVTFVGGGNGHGVGLCQQGARIMAARGIGFDRILQHYYPGTSLARVYRP